MPGLMGFDAWIKRAFPGIIVVLIAAAAGFQASGIAQLVGVELGPRDAMAAPAPIRPRAPSSPERRPSAQIILDRNPFDSSYSNVPPPPDVTEPAAPPGADWYADAPCDKGRVVLIASSPDPAWSFAALAGPEGTTLLRRRGDDFAGGKVAFIGERREGLDLTPTAAFERVWVQASNGTRCQLALGAKAPVAGAAAPKAPKSEISDKIKKTGDHAYDVDRTALQALVANPAELMKVRVVPVKDGDRVTGLRLNGIKEGSPLAAIGLENGDQLSSINGFEMTDPKGMLEAYTKLMSADHLSASVIRGGKAVQIDLAVK